MKLAIRIESVLHALICCTICCLLIGCEQYPENQTAPEGYRSVASVATLEKVQKEGTLHVTYVVYPPTVIKDPNTGELSGHFVDAIRFIADIMKVKLEFHEAQFGTFVAGLQNGQSDLSIAATYRTIPRAMAVAFTRPIIYIGNGAVVRKEDQRFSRVEDFNKEGLTLSMAQGEASHEFAREHLTQATLNVLSTADLSLPLAEVLVGRADVGLADAWTTSKFAAEHAEVSDLFAGSPYDLTPVGWAVRSDDLEWLQFLNTALDYCISTGRMAAWEAQYDAHWVKPRIDYSTE